MFLLLLLDDMNAAVYYLTHTATLAGGARMLSGKIHTKKVCNSCFVWVGAEDGSGMQYKGI